MILELNDVHTYYGTSHVLFGVSLVVNDGETVSLLGRNGAGKTTILRSIMGITPPHSGSIKFIGEEVVGKPTERIARKGIGYVPEDRCIFADLTVKENLQIPFSPQNKEWTMDDVYDLFPVLKLKAKFAGGTLSGGEQKMLAAARALMLSPRLLLFDEFAEGLSPLALRVFSEGLQKLKTRVVTMLLSEQNIKFALSLSERVYILEKGFIRYEGSVKEFREDKEVSRKYLTV
jgi:branched-chain amino acid transport system ATP-binding protein